MNLEEEAPLEVMPKPTARKIEAKPQAAKPDPLEAMKKEMKKEIEACKEAIDGLYVNSRGSKFFK